MKVVIDPGEQLKFKPIKPEIKEELELREGNKDYVHNLTPFVRVSCLQEVAYTDEEYQQKKNNLKDIKDSVLVDNAKFDGFQFTFESNFEESYGKVQKIGNTLDNNDVRIKNPRRVPPPSLDTFTATVGDSSDYFTTAKLNFTCNSLEQLQFLTPFLFNPGNTIFVEFGHNTEKLKNQISFFDSDDADALVRSSVVESDCNQANTDQEEGFIARMNKRVFDSGGSYDYFYGIINNFDFSVNDSLGFDCSVDLIAASKMKLKAPNPTEYRSDSNDNEKTSVSTLDSQLKHLEDTLYWINDQTDYDIIFSFDDSYSETYVRFGSILSFLNGDYKNGLTRRTDRNSTIASRFPFSDINVRDPNYFAIDSTELFYQNAYPIRKTNTDEGEPPVVSFSEDVIMFREKMWNPDVEYDSNKGNYVLTNNSGSYDSGIKYLKDSSVLLTKRPDTYTTQVGYKKEVTVESEFSLVESNFKSINPVLMENGVDDGFENMHNIYIKINKFRQIYKTSEGKILDILKKLYSLLNDATDGMWDFVLMGDAVIPQNSNDNNINTGNNNNNNNCEKTVTGFLSLSSTEVSYGDTYTFKADSKGSVFTSMDYGLGLDGLLGDQIYMNSINASDGSMDSQKLNLLLFAKHENNLEITDKRNERISSIRKKQEELSDGESDGSENDNDIVKKNLAADKKSKFFTKKLVKNETGNAFNALSFYERLHISSTEPWWDDPSAYRIEDISNLKINDDGRKPYTHNEVLESIFDIYGVVDVKLNFSPVKEHVRVLRGRKSKNIQTDEGNTDDSRERSFKKGGINPLLESTLSVTLPGIGGINPLEYFKVSGIPDVYANRGQFCVMDVSHTITPTDWTTQLTSRFRPTYEDE